MRYVSAGSSSSRNSQHYDFVIHPRSIFKSPLSHIHSDQFRQKDNKNTEITSRCNYGFNYDTIKAYSAMLDRFTMAQEIKKPGKKYDPSNSGFTKLNDGIPIDFGGFGPAYNKSILNISKLDHF